MPYVQEQGRAPDVARLVHLEGQRMVRDRLRQEEHAEQHGLGIGIDHRKARNQRRDGVVERFVFEAGQRIKAGKRIEIGVDRIQTVLALQIVVGKIGLGKSCRLIVFNC
jgi:hypothetical protein